jgi:hypothetical protein
MMTMPYDKLEPLASKSPLIVYVDYKSPYAYLAMEPTYALEDELGIEIDWRPFTLDIGSYLGSARLGHEGKVVENERSTGQWAKVKYAYHDVRRYGSMRGQDYPGSGEDVGFADPGNRDAVGEGAVGARLSGEDDRGARHRRIRADYLEHVEGYAVDRGLALSRLDRRQNSTSFWGQSNRRIVELLKPESALSAKYNAKQNDYREGDRKNVEKPGRTQRQQYSQCGFRAICGRA